MGACIFSDGQLGRAIGPIGSTIADKALEVPVTVKTTTIVITIHMSSPVTRAVALSNNARRGRRRSKVTTRTVISPGSPDSTAAAGMISGRPTSQAARTIAAANPSTSGRIQRIATITSTTGIKDRSMSTSAMGASRSTAMNGGSITAPQSRRQSPTAQRSELIREISRSFPRRSASLRHMAPPRRLNTRRNHTP